MISKSPKQAADLTEMTGSIMHYMKVLEPVYINPNGNILTSEYSGRQIVCGHLIRLHEE